MPFYQYYGRDRTGTPVQGKMKAGTKEAAKEKLEKKHVHVKEVIQLEGWLYQDITLFKRARPKELVLFLRQMATLLDAGITLVDSVRLLKNQQKKRLWKEALAALEADIRNGGAFSEAAEKQRHLFPALMTNMIRAGEAGGNLDTVMERLATYYEKQYVLRQKIISALAYPIILTTAAFAVVFFLLAVVVPAFADMFSGFGAELPAITQFVLTAGGIASSWWWLLLLAAAALAVLISMSGRNPQVRYYRDYALLKVPFIGGVLRKAALARMGRTWSSLFASSVPVLHAASIVERVAGNEVLARVIRDARHSLERGESVAGPMEAHWFFPPLVTQMVRVGEQTGALDKMFDRIAQFYEQEVDESTERLKSLMEPVLIAFLAVAVGIIVASIAVPMFDIFETIQ
ncbi:type II secretion system F family protein [Alkalicoccus urumqiensis]|uniref:Type II secretion system F family protein n=1 Tax=Alkalicoccus urumqiensis TaxID=1548213 RepID=A0A2P6MF19_ALKUR|nr:type II secretion system F family protein [Alkalicoccus urumqiensis]PRO64902.1 type II secretion system F family protein [Alkalicoccus urumqiensis]